MRRQKSVFAGPGLGGFLLVLFLILGVSSTAYGNRVFFVGSRAPEPQSAVRVSEPSASRVIYFELSSRTPVQWFALENDKPQELRVQVGVPAGISEPLADPVLVLFGPGLPDRPEGVTIPAPQGPDTGAVLVSKTGSPRRSHEPLTGRQSLIVAEARIELPSSGTYYGAVFDAQGREGKLWVALGQQEGLAWANLARLPSWIRQARTFHDVPGWPYWMGILGAGALAVVALVATRVMRHTRS